MTYRENTLTAILLGIAQGIILNIAFVYITLRLGFSICGSAIAAIVGYVILRVVIRNGTILENNINQTIASGINSGGIGVVFVLPAFFMLEAQGKLTFSMLPLLIAGVAGALLGILFIVPLRKQLIEIQRLRFPTGTAVATLIRSGPANLDKVKLLAIGFAISAIWKWLMLTGILDSPGILEYEELQLHLGIFPAYLSLAIYLSPLNFAAGLLSGRAGLPFLWGGLIAWWFISPSAVNLGWLPSELDTVELVDAIYKQLLRPLGIGILIGAALMDVIIHFPVLKAALHSLWLAHRQTKPHSQQNHTHPDSSSHPQGIQHSLASPSPRPDELPLSILVPGFLIAIILLFFALSLLPGLSLTQILLGIIIGITWLLLASLVVTQTTGLTDVSPISGIALMTVLLMAAALGGHIPAVLLVTLAVAIAVGQSADMMQDLKTGFLVGARPFFQQLAQLATSWLGVLIAGTVVYLFWRSGVNQQGGFGEGTLLPAPQATVLTSIVDLVQNNTVPTDKLALGALIGLLLGAAPIAGFGVLIGLAMYLPFSITLGYGLGCLTQMWLVRRHGLAFDKHKIIPLASGLIIGEALTGVGHALYQIFLMAP